MVDKQGVGVLPYIHRQTDDETRMRTDGGMKMMINDANNEQSGYPIRNQWVNIRSHGELAISTGHPSGKKESREAAMLRRVRQLEQRVFALEERLHQAEEIQQTSAEEALVAKYGESVDKSQAARIMGVTRSTVYAMLSDGRVEAAGGGKRVNVRSIARYLS